MAGPLPAGVMLQVPPREQRRLDARYQPLLKVRGVARTGELRVKSALLGPELPSPAPNWFSAHAQYSLAAF